MSEIERLRSEIANLRAELEQVKAEAILGMKAAEDKERARWESAIAPEMPADFKDWHENSPSERPAIAAWCLANRREQRDEAERMLLVLLAYKGDDET